MKTVEGAVRLYVRVVGAACAAFLIHILIRAFSYGGLRSVEGFLLLFVPCLYLGYLIGASQSGPREGP
jgi:hypothetical protein